MRFRFLGDGALDEEGRASPCVVFGHAFAPGEWEEFDLPLDRARKLAGNPAFESEGVPEAPQAPKDTAEEVDIPEDWQKLPFLAQRSLASKIESLADGAKKPQVVAIILAELERRKAKPEPDPEDEP